MPTKGIEVNSFFSIFNTNTTNASVNKTPSASENASLLQTLIMPLCKKKSSTTITMFPGVQIYIAYALNILLQFITISFLFGIIFKVLPDAKIRWRDVWVGATITAFLFTVGKFLIGMKTAQP